MKIKIVQASTMFITDTGKPPCDNAAFANGSWWIELNSIDELWELMKSVGEKLIIDYGKDGEPEIMIYDCYIE